MYTSMGNMRQIGVEELRKIQLEVLDVVTAFCDEHDIHYWLDCGTLLGAVRHKGYIPWDDDIDIGMLRPDYDKFMSLFNQYSDRYRFWCIENNPDFNYIHGKVLDTSTVLYEPSREGGEKLAINVDIFPYDNAPENEKELARMYKRRDILVKLNLLRTLNHKPNGGFIRRSIVYLLRLLLSIFPRNYFAQKALENSKSHCHEETKNIGNFTSYTKIVCDKSVFSGFVKCEFEGKMYSIPVGYDSWLRKFYKDYMQLPPIDKRVSHHRFEAYVRD